MSLSFGDTSMFWLFCSPWHMCWCHIYYICFNTFTEACTYGMTMYPLCLLFWLLLSLVLFGLFVFWKFLQCILSISCDRYLQLVRTSLMCCFSVLSSPHVAGTVLALCVKVFMALYLAPMGWWLSQSKYWPIWVCFLFTPVVNIPLFSGVTNVSKNAIEPSALVSGAVHLMVLSMLLRCWRKISLCSVHCTRNVSSVNLFHSLGGFCAVLSALFLKHFM